MDFSVFSGVFLTVKIEFMKKKKQQNNLYVLSAFNQA